MDTLGIKHVVARLNHYATAVGDKFTPAEVLVKMAENDKNLLVYCSILGRIPAVKK